MLLLRTGSRTAPGLCASRIGVGVGWREGRLPQLQGGQGEEAAYPSLPAFPHSGCWGLGCKASCSKRADRAWRLD